MLKQVSVYAENKKGTMQKITGILLDENINILGSVLFVWWYLIRRKQ